MPLIDCKVELKLKWTKYCFLSTAGNDNTNANPDNIIFTVKDTKLYFPVKLYVSKLLSKGFGRSVCWNEFKTKSENKSMTNELIFLKSNFVGVNILFVLVYASQDANAKRFETRRCCLPKKVIKNYNIIINGKNFFDQPIDYDIIRY